MVAADHRDTSGLAVAVLVVDRLHNGVQIWLTGLFTFPVKGQIPVSQPATYKEKTNPKEKNKNKTKLKNPLKTKH